jgi:hypothetical protein
MGPLLLAAMAAALAGSAFGADELLPTCSAQVFRGAQDTVPQYVLVVDVGAAELVAPEEPGSSGVGTSSCTPQLASTFNALQSYLTTAGRGDTLSYLPLNARTAVPDLAFVDQIWVSFVVWATTRTAPSRSVRAGPYK